MTAALTLLGYHYLLGNCDICAKQKILVTNEMKQDKILLKLKVSDW
jgi:hypothetical protein